MLFFILVYKKETRVCYPGAVEVEVEVIVTTGVFGGSIDGGIDVILGGGGGRRLGTGCTGRVVGTGPGKVVTGA